MIRYESLTWTQKLSVISLIKPEKIKNKKLKQTEHVFEQSIIVY